MKGTRTLNGPRPQCGNQHTHKSYHRNWGKSSPWRRGRRATSVSIFNEAGSPIQEVHIKCKKQKFKLVDSVNNNVDWC